MHWHDTTDIISHFTVCLSRFLLAWIDQYYPFESNDIIEHQISSIQVSLYVADSLVNHPASLNGPAEPLHARADRSTGFIWLRYHRTRHPSISQSLIGSASPIDGSPGRVDPLPNSRFVFDSPSGDTETDVAILAAIGPRI